MGEVVTLENKGTPPAKEARPFILAIVRMNAETGENQTAVTFFRRKLEESLSKIKNISSFRKENARLHRLGHQRRTYEDLVRLYINGTPADHALRPGYYAALTEELLSRLKSPA